MTHHRLICSSVLVAAVAVPALAQSATLLNPGFETPLSGTAVGMETAKFWRELSGSVVRRRFSTDVLSPAPLIRTGIASMEVFEGGPNFAFAGFDTDAFNSGTLMFNNPIYQYTCGPMTWSAWYAVPAASPFEFKRVGQKVEFKRGNTSVYEAIEVLPFGPESNGDTGHTNGQFQQFSITITQADLEWRFNFYNDQPPFDGVGVPFPDPPIMVNLVHFNFGTVPGGDVETGRSFWDDVAYNQDIYTAGDPIEMWDDLFTKGVVTLGAGIIEPAIPVFLNGTRLGYGTCGPANATFKILEFYDEVPNSGSFPLTWADIIANGYVRPLVQYANGTTAIGSSLIGAPSFKPQGQPLDLIPAYSRTDVTAGVTGIGRDLTANPPQAGTPTRTNNFKVQSTGNYGPATVVSRRDYGADPAIGTTTFTINYTFTATQNITLDSSATGRGFDAFRFITISSMLANIGLGQYDARFIAVEDGSGNVRTLAIDDAPRGIYLYPAAQPTAVGRSFYLYQDTDATFNPGSPSIEVELTSLTGAPGTLGVNAFLASSTNPNDDSLNAWLEWTGAPATITSGTQIVATFTIRATTPTDVGDVNHDGLRDCADVTALIALCNQTESSATFNAYADLNNDGTINGADRTALEAITGTCPGSGCNAVPPPCTGDANGDGVVNFSDVTSTLANFGNIDPSGNGLGDANHDGIVNFSDITSILANFNVICP